MLGGGFAPLWGQRMAGKLRAKDSNLDYQGQGLASYRLDEPAETCC